MTHQADLHGAPKGLAKGKRSWGDRLKLGLARGTPPEGPGPGGGGSPRVAVPPGVPPGATPNGVGNYLMHEYRNRYGSVSGGSALSKSMKYAETWLYGTVSARPVAARPSAFGLPRHPDQAAAVIAVVMCSCPEFLAGTTRSKKTASTCKKCGGTRRPMPTTVGTVRGYGTVSQPARVRPSLMELTGNPLLGHAQDPYDLMRRSRMAVDAGGGGKTHHHKSRAKSSSPPRRRRVRSPSPPKPPPVGHPAARGADPRMDPRMASSRDVGEWAMDDEELRGMRKSILECEVNPYDLISKYLKNGHGAPRPARTLCSDGGESSDNLSDNALEDLPRTNGDARARTDMTTFGKGPQPPPQRPQPKAAAVRKPLFQKEDLNKLGAKFKQTLSPDKDKAPANKKTDFKVAAAKTTASSKEAGVTISGQRIRIFNGVPGAATDGEYVSDDNLDEHLEHFEVAKDGDAAADAVTTSSSSSEEETVAAAPAAAPESPRIPRVASPKRPPRKSKQQLHVSQEAPEAASPSALQLRRQRSQSLVSPATVPEVATTIKSILKKSAGGELLSGAESVGSSSPRASPAPSSAEGSISSGTSQFYLPTFKEFKEQQKKKKQVQFRVSDDAPVVVDAATVQVVVASAAEPAANDRPADDSDVAASPEPELPAVDAGRVSSPEAGTSTDDEQYKESATDSGESSGSASESGRPRASTLRRSASERLAVPPRRSSARDGVGGPRPVHQPGDMFNDTMRLRLRAARPSSRAVFSDDSSGAEDAASPRRLSVGSQRPREPPPPPPPSEATPVSRTAMAPRRVLVTTPTTPTSPTSCPLGERPTPIGRTNSNAKAFEERVRGTTSVHRLEIKNVLFDEPPSLDIDALAQRTTSIFIDGGSPASVAASVAEPQPVAEPQCTPAGNKVTISVGGTGGSAAGDIDYQDVAALARSAVLRPVVRPVVIPVAHQNHCSRVEIGDHSDEKRTSTKMTVRIGGSGADGDEGSPVPAAAATPRGRATPSTPTSEPADNVVTLRRKRSEPAETINLLIAESVDPVDAVRRNLVPHVCGGTPTTPTTPVSEAPAATPTPPCSGGSSRSNSFDESDPEQQRPERAKAVGVVASRGKSGADIMREVLSLGAGRPDAAVDNAKECQEKEEGRSKFYVWVDTEGRDHAEDGLADGLADHCKDDFNHYEMIRDPIYEEIHVHDDQDDDVPPPLPLSPPPLEDKMACCRSIFEGASKDDILSYLVDARERGIVPASSEEMYFGGSGSSTGLCDEAEEMDSEDSQPQHSRQTSLDLTELSSRVSQLSNTSDSSEDSVTLIASDAHDDSKVRRAAADIERNDSGVGSETSRTSRARWQQLPADQRDQRHGCEDCEMPVETQVTDSGLMFAPLVCRKCAKRRLERREIIQEIVETEEKFSGDLRILLEEFYKPMLVAGLLAREQLSAIFLNAEELQAHATALAERLRDSLEMAVEQGDDDLLSVDIGRLFLAATPMLRAFEHYCTRQAAASLLLASLEKEKELLRIFLRVSQMENAVLRRMNLNSFLMVPVQRVTKYPLLLARLYKVTPCSHPAKELLLQAQHHIELHLEHMNSVAKDISSTKLWRRITITNGRRAGAESDMVNIKLRKMAVEVLEWTQDVSFPMEGRLLFAQPADSSWRRGRAVKMSPVSALLVTHGHPSADSPMDAPLHFPAHSGVRAATLLLLKEKCGRYSLLRDPLFLDKCMVCCEVEWDDYFEVQELATKDSFVFKAEDAERTRTWYRQLQLHAQGLGSWRKRRNALANIMINGMQLRS